MSISPLRVHWKEQGKLGVRKVVGAMKGQLISQFMIEAAHGQFIVGPDCLGIGSIGIALFQCTFRTFPYRCLSVEAMVYPFIMRAFGSEVAFFPDCIPQSCFHHLSR